MNIYIKKYFYILLFIFLGVLLQFLFHILLEDWYIGLLLNNFGKYNFGVSWDGWFLIHFILTIILFIFGLFFGLWQGIYWWKKIYENKK